MPYDDPSRSWCTRRVSITEMHCDHPHHINCLKVMGQKTPLTSNDLEWPEAEVMGFKVHMGNLKWTTTRRSLDNRNAVIHTFGMNGILNVLPLHYNSGVTKFTRPYVTEIEILRDTFCRYWCLYQVLELPCWSLKNGSDGAATCAFGSGVTDLMTCTKMIWGRKL